MSKDIKKFAIDGKLARPFVVQEGQIVDKLPPAYYQIKEGPFGGYYLERMSQAISLPEKIYGNAESRKTRIWDMYQHKKDSIGVGLFGDKGAGKTLLANLIANHAINQGYPVIDVSGTFSTSPEYLSFINSIGDCVVIFDEFLKHLSKMSEDERPNSATAKMRQDEMLTFFSGTNNAKRLTILIDNESYMLSNYFRDRPSRMRYLYNFSGLETEVVEELAKEYGLSADKTESLVTYNRRNSCTFDTMNEIMYEWAVHSEETLNSIVEVMNVPNLRKSSSTNYKVVSFKDNSKRLQLENELAKSTNSDSIRISTSIANPFYKHKDMSEEEFRESDIYNDMHYSFEEFKTYRLSSRIPTKVTLNDNNLIGISGNLQAYSIGEGDTLIEVELEMLTQQVQETNLGYYNFL
tara:strand:- start:2921 stop:4141 length:1221 start_codon:yes stop_codon:yes gene_type:complete